MTTSSATTASWSGRPNSEKYGAGFTVVYWDDDNEPSPQVLERLRKTALPLVLVSDVIPRGERAGLPLSEDPHPKPEAPRRLAVALSARFRAGAGIQNFVFVRLA